MGLENKKMGSDWQDQSQGAVFLNKIAVTKIMFLLDDSPFHWRLQLGQVRLGWV